MNDLSTGGESANIRLQGEFGTLQDAGVIKVIVRVACVMFRPGEPVIYAVTKSSTHPGPRAKAIFPTPKGDDYHYEVDKFWIVSAIRSDGKLVLRTRRGKERIIDPQDPLLRRARWWERLVYRSRFPQLANG